MVRTVQVCAAFPAVDDHPVRLFLDIGSHFPQLSDHGADAVAFLDPQVGDIADDCRSVGKSGDNRQGRGDIRHIAHIHLYALKPVRALHRDPMSGFVDLAPHPGQQRHQIGIALQGRDRHITNRDPAAGDRSGGPEIGSARGIAFDPVFHTLYLPWGMRK